MAKAGQPVSQARAVQLLNLVDANGDGQIDAREFASIFAMDAPDELKSLASSLDLFLDEVRDEVARAQLNGPILSTVGLAAFLGVFWKYVVEIPDLYVVGADDARIGADLSLALLQSIPTNFLDDYARAVEVAPLLTMACTSCFAYTVGDLVAQRVEGRWRAEMLDLGRVSRNAALGFLLHGPLVYGWIQILEGPLAAAVQSVGGGGDEQWSFLLFKILIDQTLFSVVINLAYASLNGILSDMRPSEAFAQARSLLVPSMVGSWRFWPAVHLISYSPLIPVDFKLLWIDTMEILSAERLRRATSPSDVLEEPGDSDLLSVGPIALLSSLTGLAALAWPQLVVHLMTV